MLLNEYVFSTRELMCNRALRNSRAYNDLLISTCVRVKKVCIKYVISVLQTISQAILNLKSLAQASFWCMLHASPASTTSRDFPRKWSCRHALIILEILAALQRPANFSITDGNFPNMLRNRLLNDATSLLKSDLRKFTAFDSRVQKTAYIPILA